MLPVDMNGMQTIHKTFLEFLLLKTYIFVAILLSWKSVLRLWRTQSGYTAITYFLLDISINITRHQYIKLLQTRIHEVVSPSGD